LQKETADSLGRRQQEARPPQPAGVVVRPIIIFTIVLPDSGLFAGVGLIAGLGENQLVPGLAPLGMVGAKENQNEREFAHIAENIAHR